MILLNGNLINVVAEELNYESEEKSKILELQITPLKYKFDKGEPIQLKTKINTFFLQIKYMTHAKLMYAQRLPHKSPLKGYFCPAGVSVCDLS